MLIILFNAFGLYTPARIVRKSKQIKIFSDMFYVEFFSFKLIFFFNLIKEQLHFGFTISLHNLLV